MISNTGVASDHMEFAYQWLSRNDPATIRYHGGMMADPVQRASIEGHIRDSMLAGGMPAENADASILELRAWALSEAALQRGGIKRGI